MILKNQLTSCYQNSKRVRSGKISHPLEADDSVEWILRATMNPELAPYKIKIVPVTITYERQYDSALLTHELISGKKVDYNAFQTIKKIYQMPSNTLGKIFVKYQEPIEVRSFIAQNQQMTFEEKAFKLTTLLYKLHQKESPITHNTLVSASILFNQRPEVSFKKIKASCDNLFKQMRVNNAKTYISNAPQAFDINEIAKALDFEVIGHFESKDAKVNLRNLQREKLFSLSLYANSLLNEFQFEALLAHSISLLEKRSNLKEPGVFQFMKADLFKVLADLQKVFLLEFINEAEVTQAHLDQKL